jgi:hypothetical protein
LSRQRRRRDDVRHRLKDVEAAEVIRVPDGMVRRGLRKGKEVGKEGSRRLK